MRLTGLLSIRDNKVIMVKKFKDSKQKYICRKCVAHKVCLSRMGKGA